MYCKNSKDNVDIVEAKCSHPFLPSLFLSIQLIATQIGLAAELAELNIPIQTTRNAL